MYTRSEQVASETGPEEQARPVEITGCDGPPEPEDVAPGAVWPDFEPVEASVAEEDPVNQLTE